MSLIKGLPRDKWEWIIITSRFVVGSGVCALALLDIGASKPIFDDNGNGTDSKIWVITVGGSYLLLIIMAITMAVLLIIENLVAYAANRSYGSFEDINFLEGPERRRTRRNAGRDHLYEKTGTDDVVESPQPYGYSEPQGSNSMYTDPYDPYHGVDNAENRVNSRGGG